MQIDSASTVHMLCYVSTYNTPPPYFKTKTSIVHKKVQIQIHVRKK